MKKFGSAVVLAGGKSNRMGFDKQLLKIRRQRLIHSLVEKLDKEFEEIIIVSNTPSFYGGYHCTIVSDLIMGKGPLCGIHAGLQEAHSEYAFVIACDMPYMNTDYVRFMKAEMEDHGVDACITRFGEWIEPFHAFYSTHILKCIENHLNSGQRSIYSLVKKLNCKYIEENTARRYSPNWEMFFNINTKEDLKEYKKGAGGYGNHKTVRNDQR